MTQWPRYEVFLREKPGQLYQHAGSVHAPDSEIALLNARDVFVRRPHCFSLWVVPEGEVLTRTAQEVAQQPAEHFPEEVAGREEEPYCIFAKLEQRGTLLFRGTLEARSALQALQRALTDFGEAMVWSVFPKRAITSSAPEDIASLFEPALEKPYKDPSYYQTVHQMYEIKKARRQRRRGQS